MITTVVFDIGNVLIEWQPERYFDRVIGESRRKAMFAAIDLHAMNDRVDQGENFKDVIYATADANPEWRAEVIIWHDKWHELATPQIDHSVRLLHALKRAQVPVFALSNFGIQTFEIAKPLYPFLAEFDRSYISGYMGVTKPNPRIYEMLEQDSGVDPTTLLFADDRRENLDAAAARGWQTHLFEGPAAFAKRLIAEGLLSEAEAT